MKKDVDFLTASRYIRFMGKTAKAIIEVEELPREVKWNIRVNGKLIATMKTPFLVVNVANWIQAALEEMGIQVIRKGKDQC